MVSTTPADSIPDAMPDDARRASSAPRIRLRNALLALCLIGVPLAWSRDPQLVWQPLLPIPLLFLGPRGTSRVLVGFAAVILLIGSGVTTYRVGMAVPDWPATFSQNMWTYPYSDMLAEGYGVTLEHVHRVWGSALGLVAICVVLSCHIYRARTGLTLLAWATLTAVSIQGLVGGTRVLSDSQNLAFLHGVMAQGVVALIVALAVVASRTWERTRPTPSKHARALYALGPIVAVAVYLQIAMGAWLRHHGEVAALLIHGTFALLVVAFVFANAKVLRDAALEVEAAGA
ncbi:MAG: COX15/CtaA family protein, partial [Planctomycetota bacterium]